jgi:hypothetical protein
LSYNQIQSMIQEQTESKARVNTTGETLATNSTFEAVIDEPYPIEENLAESDERPLWRRLRSAEKRTVCPG